VFVGPAVLCVLVWCVGVRAVLPGGPFHNAVAVLIGVATLAGLGGGVWWCALTREDFRAPGPFGFQLD
jgi:hypothetical protein